MLAPSEIYASYKLTKQFHGQQNKGLVYKIVKFMVPYIDAFGHVLASRRGPGANVRKGQV